MRALPPPPSSADDLGRLFADHHERLVRLCRRRLGPGPEAEDVAQDVLLKAWAAQASFDASRPVWPWLATIARRTCTDVQRRRRLAATRQAPLDAAPDAVDAALAALDRNGVVRAALDRMPAPSRDLLVMRDVEGWTYERIAEAQARRPGAVRMAVARARRELGGHIEHLARARGDWPLAGLTAGLAGVGGRLRRRADRGREALLREAERVTAGVEVGARAAWTAVVPAVTATALALTGPTGSTAATPTQSGRPAPAADATWAPIVAPVAPATPSSVPAGPGPAVQEDLAGAAVAEPLGGPAVPTPPALSLPMAPVAPDLPDVPLIPPLPPAPVGRAGELAVPDPPAPDRLPVSAP